MINISINSSGTERAVAELISKIQTEVIESGRTSGNMIVNAVGQSAGDFIESLKNEVAQETEIMNSVGELLIAMANYIQSASNAFAVVDKKFDHQKIENKSSKRDITGYGNKFEK